jgi:hypothetical protein
MFVTFIPRASFPVRRQPSPTLQIFSIKRNVGSYDRRSPPVPIDARPLTNLVPLNLRPQLRENDHVFVDGVAQVIGNKNQRAEFFGPAPQTR